MSDEAVVARRVITLLTLRLGIPPEMVTPTAKLAEDLGIDSVDAVEFTLALEAEFNVAPGRGHCRCRDSPGCH
jgi:acyl carrier protein